MAMHIQIALIIHLFSIMQKVAPLYLKSSSRGGIYVSGAEEAEELYEQSLPVRQVDLRPRIALYVRAHNAQAGLLPERQVRQP